MGEYKIHSKVITFFILVFPKVLEQESSKDVQSDSRIVGIKLFLSRIENLFLLKLKWKYIFILHNFIENVAINYRFFCLKSPEVMFTE